MISAGLISALSHFQLELECDLRKLGELFGGNGNFGCFVDKRDNWMNKKDNH
jgi:hypothetical protein